MQVGNGNEHGGNWNVLGHMDMCVADAHSS